MMKNIFKNFIFLFAGGTLLSLAACQDADGNQTGSEFIPDMAHSIAYEANLYTNYSFNAFPEESTVDRKSMTAVGQPVHGTIPRGFLGNKDGIKNTSESGISIPTNGFVPYYYGDSEEERLRAMTEITTNPYPISKEGLDRGKNLYNIYCGICHGEQANGLGYLVRDDGGKYPAAPANFLLDEHINATEGRYYHAIMHGRNAMGAYADKLSYEERWQVIHYIRSLQAKEKKLEYSDMANTLNSAATPASKLVVKTIETAPVDTLVNETHGAGESDAHHGNGSHGK